MFNNIIFTIIISDFYFIYQLKILYRYRNKADTDK